MDEVQSSDEEVSSDCDCEGCKRRLLISKIRVDRQLDAGLDADLCNKSRDYDYIHGKEWDLSLEEQMGGVSFSLVPYSSTFATECIYSSSYLRGVRECDEAFSRELRLCKVNSSGYVISISSDSSVIGSPGPSTVYGRKYNLGSKNSVDHMGPSLDGQVISKSFLQGELVVDLTSFGSVSVVKDGPFLGSVNVGETLVGPRPVLAKKVGVKRGRKARALPDSVKRSFRKIKMSGKKPRSSVRKKGAFSEEITDCVLF
ncbi:hypothetical protein REPUB_Repub13aG0215500 [Reevesia pubescens]